MNEDFELQGLANYLHLDLNKVKKLVERGDIPARRVGGEWKFSSAEIHHWLEDRIGVSDEAELAQVEAAMERSDTSATPVISIGELIPPGGIAYPLQARTRNSVIRAMSELAASTGLLWDADKMIAAVEQRENLDSTALDNGVASLPPRRGGTMDTRSTGTRSSHAYALCVSCRAPASRCEKPEKYWPCTKRVRLPAAISESSCAII